MKYNFLNPLLMAVWAACCLWVVTDAAYGVRIWELTASAWWDRIQALMVIGIEILAAYWFFNYLAGVFFKRRKEGKPRPAIAEYLLAVLFILLSFNICLYVVIAFINDTSYRWGEAVLINTTAIPIFLFYYTSIRNTILAGHYQEKSIQLERLKVDRLETELKLLRSQYHPHFLFNALNTVYCQIEEEKEAALESVELLSDLLRYQLYDIRTQVTLGEEMEYLKTYIRFQRLRMSERLKFEYSFDPSLSDLKIHPLLFQPLLENAFKYVGGEYRIEVFLQKEEEAKVRFLARNTLDADRPERTSGTGLGIDNLKKRLHLLYPDRHTLLISRNAAYFTADLLIDLSECYGNKMYPD